MMFPFLRTVATIDYLLSSPYPRPAQDERSTAPGKLPRVWLPKTPHWHLTGDCY